MRTVRRHLSWIICAWLVCQVSAVAAAPLLLAGDDLCTCPAGVPGAACPMHHAHQKTGECVVRSAAPVSSDALVSMIGSVGVIPSVHIASSAILPADLSPALPAPILSRADRPVSPPPRA